MILLPLKALSNVVGVVVKASDRKVGRSDFPQPIIDDIICKALALRFDTWFDLEVTQNLNQPWDSRDHMVR